MNADTKQHYVKIFLDNIQQDHNFLMVQNHYNCVQSFRCNICGFELALVDDIKEFGLVETSNYCKGSIPTCRDFIKQTNNLKELFTEKYSDHNWEFEMDIYLRAKCLLCNTCATIFSHQSSHFHAGNALKRCNEIIMEKALL